MTEEQATRMSEFNKQLNCLMQLISVDLKEKVMTPHFDEQPFEEKMNILSYAQDTYNKLFETLRDITILNNEIQQEVK